MKNIKKVNKIDIKYLKIIRKNVTLLHKNYAEIYDKKKNLILDVAPQIYEGAKKFFKYAKIKTLDIDPNSNADYICDLAKCNIIPNNKFDLIFCTEVLEHVKEPELCIRSLYRILKKNGKIIVSTPFNFRIHNPLPDYWRFSEHGLNFLFKKNRFKKIKIKSIDSERFLFPIQYILTAVK